MKTLPFVISLIILMILLPIGVFGAGFQVPEQGVAATGMGGAFIGKADDLSAVYQNPAGLAQLPGTRLFGDLVGITAGATFTRQGFDPQDNKSDIIPVPMMVISTDFGGRLENMVAAIALNAPFGLRNAYDESGPQRYATTDISLATIYTGAYLGWQMTPRVSVGGGVQYVYATGEIGQKINYGGLLNPALNENPVYDGVLDVSDVTDSGVAGNIGILVKPSDSLQIGLTWRSGINFDLSGATTLTIPAEVTQLSGGAIQSLEIDGFTTISLPQTVGAGVAFQPMDMLTLTSDLYWINWSVYENLDFDFEPDVSYLPDKEGPRNWDDTYAVRFGAEYQLNDMYAARAGYVFDQSPIPDDTLGPELPGGDRHGIAVGGGVTWQNMIIDFSYTHIFIEDRTVETSLRGLNELGDYEASANLFGISVGYAF